MLPDLASTVTQKLINISILKTPALASSLMMNEQVEISPTPYLFLIKHNNNNQDQEIVKNTLAFYENNPAYKIPDVYNKGIYMDYIFLAGEPNVFCNDIL